MKNSALSEAGGLLKQLTDCLMGKNGHAWLKALTKFVRRDSPWLWSWGVRLVFTGSQWAGKPIKLRDMLQECMERHCPSGAYWVIDRMRPIRIPSDWYGKTVYFPETVEGDTIRYVRVSLDGDVVERAYHSLDVIVGDASFLAILEENDD